MAAMPDTWTNAYNNTDQQLAVADGVLTALEDVMEAVPALNSDDPRANAIFALVAVLKEQMVKLHESHDAEWQTGRPAQAVASAEKGTKPLRDALDLWDAWRALSDEQRQAAVAHLQTIASTEHQGATESTVEGKQ